MRVLENIEPRKVMAFFEDLSGKHRCSQHEKAATDYIAAFAEGHGLTYHRDALDNIIVKKPGTKGCNVIRRGLFVLRAAMLAAEVFEESHDLPRLDVLQHAHVFPRP